MHYSFEAHSFYFVYFFVIGAIANDFVVQRMVSYPTLTLMGAQSGMDKLVKATGTICERFQWKRYGAELKHKNMSFCCIL